MIPSFRAHVGRTILHKNIIGTTRTDTLSGRAAFKPVIDEYRRFIKHIEQTTPEVLKEALEPVFEQSQVEVPKDTGALKASGYLEVTSFRGRPTVEIGYGKYGKPTYAATVHENMEYRHKKPTKSKFLEDPLKRGQSGVQQRIIALLKRAGGV